MAHRVDKVTFELIGSLPAPLTNQMTLRILGGSYPARAMGGVSESPVESVGNGMSCCVDDRALGVPWV